MPHASDRRSAYPGKLYPRGPFVDVLAGAHAEVEASTGEAVEGGRRLCDYTRVVAKQGSGDPSCDPHPLRRLRHGADGGEGEACGRVVVHPRMEMLGDEQPVESGLLGDYGVPDQRLRLPLLVPAEVVEVRHRATPCFPAAHIFA